MDNLQDQYAPENRCFGCGPANPDGLQIKSRVEGDLLVADWRPKPHHLAFEGVLNGGICGTLLDCHANWCAAYALLKAWNPELLPSTVTASFSVELRRPTPLDAVLRLVAHALEIGVDRAVIEARIEAMGKVTATFNGTFVAVKEGHPAFHRW